MSLRDEATALVARMTLAEKADFCSGADFWNLPANERLGLPSIMLTDGPHGLRKQASDADHVGLGSSVPATCFPTAAALASTWDTELLHEIGAALGTECTHNDVAVLLGPAINIKRHPLCGRNFEYFSEDPLLSGELAAAMIAGIQSHGVGACIKHFAANDQEWRRMVIDAVIDERTLREIHLRGFEIAVRKAQPWTVMCAYNRLNGTYCGEHDWLLNRVLRDDWGFEGAVVTDWGAANDRVRSIPAGLDLEMPGSGGVNDRRIEAAVRGGLLAEPELDRCVTRVVELVLKSRGRAGHSRRGSTADAHHALARRAAAQSAVLLKNENALLPLSPDARIAVVGAFAKEPRYQGTGSSRVTPTRTDCAFDAMQAVAGETPLSYAPGYDAERSEPDLARPHGRVGSFAGAKLLRRKLLALIAEAENAAREADVVVVFAGLPSVYESEGFDRVDLGLPAQHDRLIDAVCALNPNTVVVLAGGAPVEMPWVDAAGAILESYLGGQGGGSAVADILFGRSNPCAKLAETFALRQADIAADQWFPGAGRQVQYREGLYVGYRYFDSFRQPVLFPFGHGLSYTRFEYRDMTVVRSHEPHLHEVAFTLANVGGVDGAEVAQLYVHPVNPTVHRPEQELRAFRKVALKAGASRRVTIPLDRTAFAFYAIEAGDWTVESGEFEIRIGASSRDIRLRQTVVLDGGTDVIDEALRRPTFTRGRLTVDDDTFAAMLGKPIPPADSTRPFHLNSTLAEISTTWLGRRVAGRMKAQFAAQLGGNLDAATRKMVDEMTNDMPLRSLVLFSGGKLSFGLMDAFAAILNGRYLTALRQLVAQMRTPR